MELRSHIRSMKERLKKARQRVDWARGTVEWITFDDVLDEVQAHTWRANEIWEAECFTLELYAVDGGRKTKAMALADWAKEGMSRVSCEYWWEHGAEPEPLNEWLPVDDVWKKQRIKEMTAAQGSG